MISHTPLNFPHQPRVSDCARTDLNRRPLGSKPGSRCRGNSLFYSVSAQFCVGKQPELATRNTGKKPVTSQNFPQRITRGETKPPLGGTTYPEGEQQ